MGIFSKPEKKKSTAAQKTRSSGYSGSSRVTSNTSNDSDFSLIDTFSDSDSGSSDSGSCDSSSDSDSCGSD